MGLFDRLKKWAEDKVDDVEEALDDAGSYIKEKAEDIAGENTWASKIIDKIDDYIPSAEEIVDKATDAATDYVGDEIKGTWAGDAADTLKDVMGGDTGDIAGKATSFLGDQLEGTWAGDAATTVKDVLGGSDGGVEEGMIAPFIKLAPETGLDPAASTMTADDLGPVVEPRPAAAPDDILGRGIVPPTLDPAMEPAMPAPADDILGRGIVPPTLDPAMEPAAPATDMATDMAPVEAAVMTPVEPVAMPEPAPVAEEPAVTVEPEPTHFETSMAAADEVEASVDDMFADIA